MFRFTELKVWQKAIVITNKLFDIADELAKKGLYQFAEQLRGAALSITNNIAEGSACQSRKGFSQFLNYSRRSAFEVVNMLYIFALRKYITEGIKDTLSAELEELCRMLSGFMKNF